MKTERVRARLVEDDGDTHWVTLVGRGRIGAFGITTDWGFEPMAVVPERDDEPVTCSGCLAAEGGPWVEEAERIVRAVGQPVTA